MPGREFLWDVARRFADAPLIEACGHDGALELVWTRGDIYAGVIVDEAGAQVFLDQASAQVDSADRAVKVLSAIFADRIVAVCFMYRGGIQHAALTRPENPTAAFARLDTFKPGDVPPIDQMVIRSWSGALDHGDWPEFEDAAQQDPETDEPGLFSRVQW